jgi:hypothetical protein
MASLLAYKYGKGLQMAFRIPEYTERVQSGSAGAAPRLDPGGAAVYDVGADIRSAADEAQRAFSAYEHTQMQDAQANAARAAADLRMEIDTEFVQRSESAEPGAPGFTPDLMGRYNERLNEVSEGLETEAARKAFRDKMLPYEVQLNGRSLGFEQQQRRDNRILNTAKAIDTSANQLFVADPDSRKSTYAIAQATIAETIHSLDVSSDVKQKLYMDLGKKLSYAAVQGDLRDRPEKVRDWLVQDLQSVSGAKANTGVEYYSRLKTTESGGRNIGSDTSSAFGPYQFTKSTWSNLLKRHPELGLSEQDRFKPAAQEIAIRAFTQDNAKLLETAGYPPTNANLYMMHFLGEGGGPRFLNAVLKHPDADARGFVSSAAVKANPGIFKPGRSVADVYKIFGKKMGGETSFDKSSGAPGYYADLTFESRDQLYGAAEAEIRKRQVQQNAAFKQRADNSLAETSERGGASDVPTEQEFIAAYGANKGGIAYGEFQAATVAAKAGYDLKRMPLRDHGQYVEGLKPEKGDAFYDERLRGYYGAKAESQNIRNAIADDAASYAVTYNPELKEALGVASTLNPEDPKAAKAATDHYTAMLVEEYDKLGVPIEARKLVPKSYAETIAATLGQTLETDNGARLVVAQLTAFKQMWGNKWPRVYEDLRESMTAPLKVITSGIQPHAAQALAQVHDKSFEDLTKVIPKADKLSIEEDLQSEFDPYIASAGFQVSASPHINTLFEQAKKLAAMYVTSGDSVSTAAERAYDDLLGFKYQMENSSYMNIRVPKPGYFDGLEVTLEQEHRNLTREGNIQLFAAGNTELRAALSTEYLQRRTRDWLAREGKWVTLPDDSGVGFVVGGKMWNYRDGRPITLTWDQVREKKEQAFKDVYQQTDEMRRQELYTGYDFR